MRAREYGLNIGSMPTGKLNKITDVPGVSVGHSTVIDEKHQTGVTVIMPCPENPFTHKLPCASYVLNGFGKTAGTVQIEELGTLETPIAMTGTLNVGKIHDAMVGYMIDRCALEGKRVVSVNPLVCECNDGSLSDGRDRPCDRTNLDEAIASACEDFAEGAVGSGRGMGCHGLKGGIGSSSRIVNFDGKNYTIGVLVMTNHGKLRDLQIDGRLIGPSIDDAINADLPDKGSCIVILATDIPASDRQLKRIIKRCDVGLIRLGSFIGHGSGEVFIGFSTANRTSPKDTQIRQVELMNEDCIDTCFRAAAEATEEAILNAMFAAEAVTNASTGKTKRALSEFYGKV